MTLKYKFLQVFLTAFMLTLLAACGQSSSKKSVPQLDNLKVDEQALTIDTFSIFPPEIDGCSCYFSSDSTEFRKSKYIYMNNYAQTSFIKVKGVLTKFTQTEFKEIDSTATVAKAKSDNYDLIIEVKYLRKSGYETYLNTGIIKLTDKKGKTITKTFYGECGC